MIDLHIASGETDFLGTIELEVPGDYLEEQRSQRAHEEIRTLLGRRNKVSVGVPIVVELSVLMQAGELLHEARSLLERYDFFLVRFACSFLPDTGCRFTWARFGIALTAKDIAGVEVPDHPFAYDLFPREIHQFRKRVRGIKLTPSLKLDFGPATVVEAEAGEVTRSEEYLDYEPEIVAFGLLDSDFAWDFRATKGKSVMGSSDLFALITKPKGTHVFAQFELGAEVEDVIFGILPLRPVHRHPVLTDKYLIC